MIWRVEHFEEIDSTNSWLAGEAKDGAPEGTVAYADFQSAGRGRLDRKWVSPPGSALLCSILLRPSLGASELYLAVAAVALSARAALVRLSGVRPSLKWPNDLLVGEQKLAGLLGEIVQSTAGLAVVVGIGINLSDAGPDGVRATSVLDESGVTIAPRALLDILLEEVEFRRALLETAEGRESLRQEYERALVTLGQSVRIELVNAVRSGIARGVDASGQLMVDVDGTTMSFNAGDVIHLRSSEEASRD
ncbi:MAG: biotin--[acetyl-CoA-carboxylase] ligase [Acidobacteria bacterium]|nr:biotin--[acetyl-CoA-carboxylase] ligase [Acidobacteriota bacterium]